MTSRPPAPSKLLSARVIHAALCAVRDAGGSLRLADIKLSVQKTLQLDDWAKAIIESNRLPRWETYLHFASDDTVKAGYLTKDHGLWTLTETGIGALDKAPDDFLAEANSKYREWQKQQTPKSVETVSISPENAETDIPPEDGMESILKEAHSRLAAEILEQLRQGSPAFFERVVLETLLRMGYGGSRQEAGRTVGKTGDGGIDGIINEDRLGLDAVYIQAKRWANDVGAGEIRDFKGALDGHGAAKGVFITTAGFTRAALDEVSRSRNYKIVLIDGAKLARFMIEYNVGVSTAATYELKKIDSDYFSEE